MGRWLRVWAVLVVGHALGVLAVRWATGTEMDDAQAAIALLLLPVVELGVLGAAAGLGGPSPRA